MSAFDEAVEAAAQGIASVRWSDLAWEWIVNHSTPEPFRAEARAALTAAGLPDLLAENERLRKAPSTQPYDVVIPFPEAARDRYMFEAGRVHQCRGEEGCCEGCQTHHGCRCGDENGGY